MPSFQRRLSVVVALLLGGLVANACADDLDGYLDPCTDDEDCAARWSCLERAPDTGIDEGRVCSQVCEDEADCPKLTRRAKRNCDDPPSRYPCIGGICGLVPCD